MEITVSLDLNIEADRKILEMISAYKALQAQGKIIPEKDLPAPIIPSPQPKAAVIKEMGQIADRIGHQVGAARSKMSNAERARCAAKARWEKQKAIKEGRPIPAKAQKKKDTPHREQDFSRAEEHALDSFKREAGIEVPEFPDGREIIDGSWRFRTPPPVAAAETDSDDLPPEEFPMEDEEIEEIRKRATEYEKEPR